MPKISVIMPVYNCSATVERAVLSILRQTFSDFELLILDDNSDDQTGKLVREFTDPRIKYFRYEKNRGCTHLLNEGLKLSVGKYIARMDGDDESFPSRFAEQIMVLEKRQQVGVVGVRSYLINPSAMRWSVSNFGDDLNIRKALRYCNPIIHSSVMLRSSVISDLGGYDTFFKTSQDYDLWWRILSNTDYKMHIIPRILHARYEYQNSVSGSNLWNQVCNGYVIRSRYVNFPWNVTVSGYHYFSNFFGRLLH